MDRKNLTIAAGVGSAIALIGLGFYGPEQKKVGTLSAEAPAIYPEQFTKPMTEGIVVEAKKTIEQSALEAAGTLEKSEDKIEGLEQLSMTIGEQGSKELSADAREKIAAAVINVYAGTEDETLKKASLRLLWGRIGGEAGQLLAAETLSSGTDDMKAEVVKALAGPHALRGKELSEKALEVARGESVPDEIKPAFFKKALGKKAEPELLALIEKDVTPETLRRAAVELQNLGKPEHLARIIEKLDGRGMLDKDGTMPWFSAKLLSDHIRTAANHELVRAVKIVQARPALARATGKALKDRIGDADPAVRRTIARAIPNVVDQKAIEATEGEQTLAQQLEKEQDPTVRTTIEDSIAMLRLTQPEPQPEQGGGQQ